ncbi:hypothetical protein M413DRAFT_283104 [Hebeloma cylindrosporum]|uniref:BTB domain-containing protein n=1 Tax=Hebeloma cylindrosporum TaxID=76867 RepID=A0A0C3BJ44_HEBCY|nr:hypothetical protein M413DRAFT_283104 [Hebeloma cylindrosporum h7]
MPTSQLDMYTPSTKFWLSDGTVIFRVENSLYKVHRHFFEVHSEHFKKLLSTYWFSPMSHLFLPEIKKTEFEMLLSIFYPTDLTKPDITTVEGWTSILALSYKYAMPQLESLSIQNLHALTTPVQKIALAKKFDFGKKHHHSWLIPAYVDLCSRDAPLSLEEAEQLDMPTVIMVWNVRHAVGVVMARGRRGVVVQDELVLRLVKENWGLGQEEEDHHEDMNGNGNGHEFDAMWPDFQFAG